MSLCKRAASKCGYKWEMPPGSLQGPCSAPQVGMELTRYVWFWFCAAFWGLSWSASSGCPVVLPCGLTPVWQPLAACSGHLGRMTTVISCPPETSLEKSALHLHLSVRARARCLPVLLCLFPTLYIICCPVLLSMVNIVWYSVKKKN